MPANEISFPVWSWVLLVSTVVGASIVIFLRRKRRLWWRGDQVSSAELSQDREFRLKQRQRHQYE